MGIKKIARPLNKAKNEFVKWLKNNNGDNIDVYYGHDVDNQKEWDYYCCVSGFVNDSLYTIYFTMWNGQQKIEYSDEENSYDNLTIEDFLELIK